MRKKLFCHFIAFYGLGLFFCPNNLWADFLIEFTNGQQVTVRHYVDDGQTLTIHAKLGTIGFRKADVKRITPIDADLNGNPRLEDLPFRSAPLQEKTEKSTSLTKRAPSVADTATESSQQATPEGTLTKAALERLDGHYQQVTKEMDGLWEKHGSDLSAGSSKETLAENRRRLHALDQERNALIKAARRTRPDIQPPWAQ